MSYDNSKYDMTNDVVKEPLDIKYHLMHITIFNGICSAHEHPVDYCASHYEPDDGSDDENTIHDELVTYKTSVYMLDMSQQFEMKKSKNSCTGMCKWTNIASHSTCIGKSF